MSETDSSQSDQAYFRAIEETFIGLRGTPFLLSPADWQQAQQWHRQGIPLELVLATLEALFRARSESGTKRKVQSLRYCASAVEEAWQELNTLTASGTRTPPEPLDPARRLRVLAESIPESLPNRDEISGRILALSGNSEEIERGLMMLDQLVLQSTFDAMSESEQDTLHSQVGSALAKLDQRLGYGSHPEVRQRLFDQTVRSTAGLPFLSLFSSEPPS